MSLLEKENMMWYLVSHPEELEKIRKKNAEHSKKIDEALKRRWKALPFSEKKKLVKDSDEMDKFILSIRVED